MPTFKQIQLLHLAYKKAGLSEPQYRMLLWNVGDVDSSKKLSQIGFESVMAVLEDCGFHDSTHGETYWRDKVALRGKFCGERLVFRIEELAGQQKYDLAVLCRRFSQERTEFPSNLRPREAFELIQMLKAVIERGAQAVQGTLFSAPSTAG